MEDRESYNKDTVITNCMCMKCCVFCNKMYVALPFLDKKKGGQFAAILIRKLSLGKGFSHHSIHYDFYFLKKTVIALTNIMALFLSLLSCKVKGGEVGRCSTHKIIALS